MAKRKQSKLVKTLISFIKDKTSIFLRPRDSSSIHVIDRLRRTSSAHVALKCLIVIRLVIANGSFVFHSHYNFLNLSGFRDNADIERWELSNWVRFYACYLEVNLIACRKLGIFISNPDKNVGHENGLANLSNLSKWELMREIEVLVGLIEEICNAPGAVFNYKGSLVYEILRLICEDYGHIQRLVLSRLGEFRDRVTELEGAELDELAGFVRRAEGCRERLSETFGNRKRNDAFWEFLVETKHLFGPEKRTRND